MRINPQSCGNILMAYKLLYRPWINTHAQDTMGLTFATGGYQEQE
jgi:hypothetical protein